MTDLIHVLHVDDESDFAEMAAEFLQREDDRLTVTTATSASESLDRLASNDFECIVSDYDMPGQNGIEFLETVRKEYPDLPFILYTGKGSEEVASEAISAGVTDYLQKERGTDQYTILANRIQNYVERTRAQRESEAMRERMDLALEHTDSVIFEIDLDTGAVRRLGDFEQFFDVPPEDVPTWEDHLEQAVHPDDQERFREFHQQLVEGERESGILEYRIAPDSDAVRWIRDNVYVREGDPRKAIGLAQDITRHKEREQSLERYYKLVNEMPDPACIVDEDGRYEVVNEAMAEIHEMSSSALEGERSHLIQQLGAEYENNPYQELVDGTRDELRGEQTMELPGAGSFTVEYWFRPITDDGTVTGAVVVSRDITKRKQHERELELKTRAMDEAPVGILITDQTQDDNPIIYANERFQQLTGYAEEEILGRNCRFLQGEDTDPEPVAEMRGAIDNHEPVTVELRNYRKDGTEFWNRVSIAPVENDDGDVTHFVGFQQDITEWKE